ncbi:NAD(P)H-dependent oxidoreductase subunit E [Thioalkalivibrio sp. HK1]|uniref:NAD(P)H-dependent oxidoreductase subunit E n=1 Tax=Thioalkalivibrio sp. HK1 TaxID=1469245 RepID=UPI0004711FA1|nr:NAD(P)H-dependent oxidoreductase subunit E [Thioalkalivibrio sp. HK1]
MPPEHHEAPRRRRHPGSGRGAARPFPKGRQVDPKALEEVRDLLGDRPRLRDLLIEHLHLIQDKFGCIGAAHLAALAQEMRLPMAEVFEVATFYAHFDVLREGEPSPPPITIRVCDSLSCELAGAKALLERLPSQIDEGQVRVIRAPCMGRCDRAPVAEVGHRHVDHADESSIRAVVESGDFSPRIPDYRPLAAYRDDGGYDLLRRCLGEEIDFDAIAGILDESGLRGLGGAGFPTGRKWRIVRSFAGPRLMAVNADEGEPGTFKDRHYLESDPHRFLEGVLVAAWAVEAQAVYLYLRDEYPFIRELLLREIAALEDAGLIPHTRIHLRRGAGAYICGEESSMIESIEGKRGLPRHRPPYVAEKGIFSRPTLVQNVETLYWIRDIVEKGPQWFASQGRNGGKGLRSYSVSGRVASPGVKLAPAGITLRELVDEFCGGMLEGHRLRGYLPGGASGGILPASMADLPLEFGSLEKHGCFVGSHAVVVLSDRDDMKAVALNLMRFFEDESCGQCTPCRVGTAKAVRLMDKDVWDEALLAELGQVMSDASICGLGQAAANPLNAVLRYFKEEAGLSR